jgi:biotin operon repressor
LASERVPRVEIDGRSGYGMPDLVRLFLELSSGPSGRTVLMKKLGLGEATVKTMMKSLRDMGLVKQGTRGVYPTKKGLSLFSFCAPFSALRRISIPEFSKKAAALLVKGAAGRAGSGIEQRDEGVKHGAKIITLVNKGGSLMLAGVPQQKPPYTQVIEKALESEDGDVVILSGADSRLDAERGAVAAGLVTI